MVSMKRQILGASGFAGVSNLNVPNYLQGKYVNLSDGIDTDYFDPQKARPGKKKIGTHLIFLPSRITPEKGHLDAIRAIALVNREGVNTRLVFAGACYSEAYFRELNAYIDKEDLNSQITFAGQITIEELRDFYAASDVIILPSFSEGLGRVLLEAQAMKKPVIAYNTGGIPEAMLNGQTGYIVRKGDYRDLAARLKGLLLNDAVRNQMGESAREFILGRFNYAELTKRHEEFYVQALITAKTRG